MKYRRERTVKKSIAFLLIYLGCINLTFAKPIIDCKDFGFWAAEVTLQKNNGASLSDAEGVFNLRENMTSIEKELLIKMAEDIYTSDRGMDKDTANDFYRKQCEIGLGMAK